LFIEEGYESITIERVAERSGVSKKSIYAWFKNKSSLMEEVITDIANNAHDILIKGVLPESGNVEDDLYNIAVSMLESFYSAEAMSVSRFIFRESHKYPEFRNYIESFASRDIYGVLAGIFEKHSDSIISLKPSALAHRFLNFLSGNLSIIIANNLEVPDAAKREAEAREVARLFVHGILK
jgi:AcrR family transcriptional regulator